MANVTPSNGSTTIVKSESTIYEENPFKNTFDYEELALKEFKLLKTGFENLKALTVQTLASDPFISIFDIDDLKAKVADLTFACYLSRYISKEQEKEVLALSEEISAYISNYLEAKDPYKYPSASSEEKGIFRDMITLLESYKRRILNILYDVRRESQVSVQETQNMMKRTLSIRANLSGYYTEFDPDYRSVLMLEKFVSQVIAFLNQGSDEFGSPSGIQLLIAQQSKWLLLEFRCVVKGLPSSETDSQKALQLESSIFEEVNLVSLFGLTNGKISLEIDSILRDIRNEFIRRGLHSALFDDIFLDRMKQRFEKILLSVEHVIENTLLDRARENILPGEKSRNYLKLDTPLSRYFLSFTECSEEFLAWNFEVTDLTSYIFELIEIIRSKIYMLKGLGRVLPQQKFWESY